MRSVKTLFLCILCVFLAAAIPASALDGTYFSLSGYVTDANWNPIQGAVVTLYNNDFDRVTTTVTTESGYFAFEGVSVKTNLCSVRISYTEGGVEHEIPGYYIPALTASGDIRLAANQTHYDNYYLPGSQPHVTPTPTPSPTPSPTAAPSPTEAPVSQCAQALIFAGGFAIGAITATLTCFIVFRHRRKI